MLHEDYIVMFELLYDEAITHFLYACTVCFLVC